MPQTGFEVFAIGTAERHQLGKAQAARVSARNAHCLGVDIEAEQLRRPLQAALEALIGIGEKVVESIGVEVGAALEAPVVARKARGAVGGHHGSFQHQRAAAASGVYEYRSLHCAISAFTLSLRAAPRRSRKMVPAAPNQHTGGKGFLERRFHVFARHTVAAAMQRFARVVDGNGGLLAMERHPNGHIGALRLHIGAFATRIAQAIAHGILHLQSRELGVAQRIVGTTCRNGNRRTFADDHSPRKLLHATIKGIGAIGIHTAHHPQHARGNARPQADPVALHLVAEERHPALQGTHALRTKALQLIGQDLLKPLRARSEEFKFSVVHRGSPITKGSFR